MGRILVDSFFVSLLGFLDLINSPKLVPPIAERNSQTYTAYHKEYQATKQHEQQRPHPAQEGVSDRHLGEAARIDHAHLRSNLGTRGRCPLRSV